MGGTIVSLQSYSAGAPDFHAALTQIKATNPDVLFVPGYYTDIGPIAKQAREVGLTVPLLGGDGWDSPALVKGAGGPGGALEGSFFTDHYSVNSTAPTVRKFVAAYKAANNGAVPDALAALGYDAGGRPDFRHEGRPRARRWQLRLGGLPGQTARCHRGDQGLQGRHRHITIGPDRNAVKPASVLKIVGDQFQLAGTINP